MLDFICLAPVDLPGARRKRQNTKCIERIIIWNKMAVILVPSTGKLKLVRTSFKQHYSVIQYTVYSSPQYGIKQIVAKFSHDIRNALGLLYCIYMVVMRTYNVELYIVKLWR